MEKEKPQTEEKEKEGYDEFTLKEACETLAKAEEIKADAKLMTALQPLLEKKSKAYHSLADLRSLAGKKKLDEVKKKKEKV